MNVKELIEELQSFDPEMEIFAEIGYTEVNKDGSPKYEDAALICTDWRSVLSPMDVQK